MRLERVNTANFEQCYVQVGILIRNEQEGKFQAFYWSSIAFSELSLTETVFLLITGTEQTLKGYFMLNSSSHFSSEEMKTGYVEKIFYIKGGKGNLIWPIAGKGGNKILQLNRHIGFQLQFNSKWMIVPYLFLKAILETCYQLKNSLINKNDS